MKKLLLIILSVLCVAALFILLRSKEKPANVLATAPSTTTSSTSKQVDAVKASQSSRFAPVTGNYLSGLRAAVALGDRGSLDQASTALLEYINSHPEQVDDYVTTLRSEKDEQVLRFFALTMAQSEVGLLENDKIIQAAIELSKDSSFEQRQHIMLNLMAKFPEMRDDVYQNVLELSEKDPNSQVKTSAVVVLADWMERFPEKNKMLLEQVGQIFNSAVDEDVRAFTYQIMALKKDELSRDLQLALMERLKTEPDSFSGNLIVLALSAAPEDIRQGTLSQIQAAFSSASDPERQRNLLAQIVSLEKQDSIPLLEKHSTGNSLLAQDAKGYLALLSANTAIDSETIFQDKGIRDANRQAALEPHVKH